MFNTLYFGMFGTKYVTEDFPFFQIQVMDIMLWFTIWLEICVIQ